MCRSLCLKSQTFFHPLQTHVIRERCFTSLTDRYDILLIPFRLFVCLFTFLLFFSCISSFVSVYPFVLLNCLSVFHSYFSYASTDIILCLSLCLTISVTSCLLSALTLFICPSLFHSYISVALFLFLFPYYFLFLFASFHFSLFGGTTFVTLSLV